MSFAAYESLLQVSSWIPQAGLLLKEDKYKRAVSKKEDVGFQRHCKSLKSVCDNCKVSLGCSQQHKFATGFATTPMGVLFYAGDGYWHVVPKSDGERL